MEVLPDNGGSKRMTGGLSEIRAFFQKILLNLRTVDYSSLLSNRYSVQEYMGDYATSIQSLITFTSL